MITYACMMAVPLSTVKALTVCAISHRLNKTKNSNLVVADRGVPNVRHSSGESSRDSTSSKDQMYTSMLQRRDEFDIGIATMKNVVISHWYGRPKTVDGEYDSARLCESCTTVGSRARLFLHCSNWPTLDLLCMFLIFLLSCLPVRFG